MTPIWRLQFWKSAAMYVLLSWRAALPLAVIWSFLERMTVGTLDALSVSPVLLGLAILMLLIDTLTGCYKGLMHEGQTFSTKAFAVFFDKVIKYAVVVLVFSSVAAVAEKGDIPEVALAWLRDFGYLVVVVREGGSAVENLWGKPLGKLIAQFRETVGNASR